MWSLHWTYESLGLAIPSLFSPYLEGIVVNSTYVQQGPPSVRSVCASVCTAVCLYREQTSNDGSVHNE